MLWFLDTFLYLVWARGTGPIFGRLYGKTYQVDDHWDTQSTASGLSRLWSGNESINFAGPEALIIMIDDSMVSRSDLYLSILPSKIK